MLILLKVAAVLAFIILPLISPKKKLKRYKKNEDVSGFTIGPEGDIRNKDDDKNYRQRANQN